MPPTRTTPHSEAETDKAGTPVVATRLWRHRLSGVVMPEKRKKFDQEFRAGAVRMPVLGV